MTEGETLDRIILEISINDTKKTAAFICDHIVMVIKNQTEEQVKSTLLYLMSFCLASISSNKEWAGQATNKAFKELEETYESVLEFLNDADK